MRLIIAGFAIMLLSLFAVTAPSASPDDLSVASAPADQPTEVPVDIEEEPSDVDIDDEEVVEMACVPRARPCGPNSTCCSVNGQAYYCKLSSPTMGLCSPSP